MKPCYVKDSVDNYNSMVGDLADGIDCPKCLNKGFIETYQNKPYPQGIMTSCECQKQRRINRILKNSGLGNAFEKMTLDNFKVEQPFQENMLKKAKMFIGHPKNKWLYIGGQIGSGKTMLCVGISKELVLMGYDFEYLNFSRDYGMLLRQLKNYDTTIQKKAQTFYKRLVKVEVLYIDDFLKDKSVDIGDVFMLINDRYLLDNITIISSEKTLSDIINIDEALSRIREKTGSTFNLAIKNEKGRNKRL